MNVFLLGLDGMTLRILTPLVENGLLPNFGRIMKDGAHGVLRSTIPPVSGPGWLSMVTGKNPGKHGVFEFRKREGYQWTFLTKNPSSHCDPIWNILSRQGKRVAVINVPMTYPPDEVNGIMVSGLMTPGVDKEFTYPSSIREEIFQVVPDYQLDVDEKALMFLDDKAVLLREVFQVTEARRKVMNHFLDQGPWDLFFIAFVGTDRLQHYFWDEIMSMDPECVRFYQLLDEILGDILKRMDKESLLLVASDHGFMDGRKAVCLNRAFEEFGWLKPKRTFQVKKRLSQIGLSNDILNMMIHRIGLNNLKDRMPRQLLDFVRKFIPNTIRVPNEIDWAKTKVFVFFGYGIVHINLEGREPEGIVKRSEYDDLCEEVKRGLLALRYPGSDEEIFKEVFRGDEIYPKGYDCELPDLVAVLNEGFSVLPGMSKDVFMDTRFGNKLMTGNHDENGVYFAHGNMVQPQVSNAEIYDITPTLLYAMGLGIPEDVDGKVLADIFLPEFQAQTSVRFEKAQDSGAPGTPELKEDESAAIGERLKSLGYFE